MEDDTSETSMSLHGSIATQLKVLSGSDLTLVTTYATGKGDEQVLVPLCDWQLIGAPVTDADKHSIDYSVLLTFDNVAFLLKDASEDFALAAQNLVDLGADPAAAVSEQVVHWLRDAALAATKAADSLESRLSR